LGIYNGKKFFSIVVRKSMVGTTTRGNNSKQKCLDILYMQNELEKENN